MKFLVTGATGFVGGRLARQLRAAGHDVVAVVRSPEKAQELAGLGVRLAPGDVTEKESLRAPMTGVDGVFHLAAWYKVGVKDRTQAERINVEGTRHVLELMREIGIPRGVYTSTLAVNSDTHGQLVDESFRYFGAHLSEYDRTKAEAHRVAEEFIARGLPLVIVLPGLVYGPGDTSSVRTTFVNYLLRKLPAIPERTAFCWAHVDDVAAAHRLAMEKGRRGENYIICGPPHTLVEAMTIAQEITGVPRPPAVPPFVFQALAPVMGVVEQLVTVPDSYTAEGLRVVAGTTYIGNNAKARGEFDYEPRPLRIGLREWLEYEMKLLGMR